MRTAALSLILLALMAVRRRRRAMGARPQPGHPARARCRHRHVPRVVRQPSPGRRRARRVAIRPSGSRRAIGTLRVIYGDDQYGSKNSDQRYRDRTKRLVSTNGGVYKTYPKRSHLRQTRTDSNGRLRHNSCVEDNGYRDGLEKGREDAGDRTTRTIRCVTAGIARAIAATTAATARARPTSSRIVTVSRLVTIRLSIVDRVRSH